VTVIQQTLYKGISYATLQQQRRLCYPNNAPIKQRLVL